MKSNISYFLIVLLTITSTKIFAQKKKPVVHWVSVEQAFALQKKHPKKILIDVHTCWCGPCRQMLATTYKTPEIVNYLNKHFYTVKFDAESPDTIRVNGKTFTNPNYVKRNHCSRNGVNQLTYAIANEKGRIAYPTSVFFDKQDRILQGIQGFLPAKQFLPILKYFAEDYYKTTPWPTYIKAYNAGKPIPKVKPENKTTTTANSKSSSKTSK